MNYIQTEIDGVWLIEPKVFFDERGYFMEAFKKEEFESHIGPVNFVQDNESKSSFGGLRGVHYQKDEYSQAKFCAVGVVMLRRCLSSKWRLNAFGIGQLQRAVNLIC